MATHMVPVACNSWGHTVNVGMPITVPQAPNKFNKKMRTGIVSQSLGMLALV